MKAVRLLLSRVWLDLGNSTFRICRQISPLCPCTFVRIALCTPRYGTEMYGTTLTPTRLRSRLLEASSRGISYAVESTQVERSEL